MKAALSARAAQEQGKFWDYHALLYENQSAGFSEETLIELAREADLDVEKFEKAFQNRRHEGVVMEDFEEGQRLGVSGTPTFVVNGRVVVGFQSAEVFGDVIEEAKREADGGS